jgi:hypothetical protein
VRPSHCCWALSFGHLPRLPQLLNTQAQMRSVAPYRQQRGAAAFDGFRPPVVINQCFGSTSAASNIGLPIVVDSLLISELQVNIQLTRVDVGGKEIYR